MGGFSNSPAKPRGVRVYDSDIVRGDVMSGPPGMVGDGGRLTLVFGGSDAKRAFGLADVGGWALLAGNVIYCAALLLYVYFVFGRD